MRKKKKISHTVWNTPCMLSRVWLYAVPWTEVCQVPLSMEFSRQEYWNGVSFLSQGDLSNSGIKLVSLASLTLAGRFFTTRANLGKLKHTIVVTISINLDIKLEIHSTPLKLFQNLQHCKVDDKKGASPSSSFLLSSMFAWLSEFFFCLYISFNFVSRTVE